MDAGRLKEMITAIRQQGLSRYISVQTNATLLDEELMGFFPEHGVNLEVGIDGDEATTQRNRPGIGELLLRGYCPRGEFGHRFQGAVYRDHDRASFQRHQVTWKI